MSVIFDDYRAVIRFGDRLVGGIPRVPAGADPAATYEAWAREQGVGAPDAHELAGALAEDDEIPVYPAPPEP